jgi:hypothetical protein
MEINGQKGIVVGIIVASRNGEGMSKKWGIDGAENWTKGNALKFDPKLVEGGSGAK